MPAVSPGRVWRSLVTSLCFVAFGVGGTLMSLTLMPLLTVLPGTTEVRRRRARVVIGACFRALVLVLTGSGCMRLHAIGIDRLRAAKGALILANHPTYIDVVVLLSLHPQANCVVKGAMWRNPFYWGIVRAAGYINNTSPEEVVESCALALRNGETLLVFPEGTRSTLGSPLRFQRGAAHVALKSEAPVLPVLITCDPPTLGKETPWWCAPARPFDYAVDVREEVPQRDLFIDREIVSRPETTAISARHLTESLETYFSNELKTNDDYA